MNGGTRSFDPERAGGDARTTAGLETGATIIPAERTGTRMMNQTTVLIVIMV
jgi:hypothetical protein